MQGLSLQFTLVYSAGLKLFAKKLSLNQCIHLIHFPSEMMGWGSASSLVAVCWVASAVGRSTNIPLMSEIDLVRLRLALP